MRSFFDLGDNATASIARPAPLDPSQELKMEEEAPQQEEQSGRPHRPCVRPHPPTPHRPLLM
jgi:hypothetical protein